MPKTETINFKDPLWMTAWLDAALEKEQEKYSKCPVLNDSLPGYVDAQAWGYVVTGYFLLEESLKAVLHMRGEEVRKWHSLSRLFSRLKDRDQEVLREFYRDFHGSIGSHGGRFPFESVDAFLVNLDGDEDAKGRHIGSLKWRYFLIEQMSSGELPTVSAGYLHEVIFGCIRICQCVSNDRTDPLRYKRTERLRRERLNKYNELFRLRINSPGWSEDDRCEILWGPDHQGRYDLYCREQGRICFLFSSLPTGDGLRIIDFRPEVGAFDLNRDGERMGEVFNMKKLPIGSM